jgi:hypothetical protein
MIKLPGSRMSASRLGFGLSGLHHLLRRSRRQSLLSSAFDHGITYFDTAPYYGHGLAERELGRFASGRRERVVIATKAGIEPDPWLRRLPALMYPRLAANVALRRLTGRKSFVVARQYDYRGASTTASVERSLRALRSDYIDILYLHDPALDRLTEPDILFETLQRLRASGKVRSFGLAGDALTCLPILRRFPIDGCLVQLDAGWSGRDLQLFRAQSIPFQSSYGHFRNRKEPMATLLSSAVRANRDGVILFSTRHTARIGAMVDMLSTLEPV